jgi:poly(A) polymerase
VVPERFGPVLAELDEIGRIFRSEGHRLYLVGGTVRDLLSGTDTSAGEFDFDATTDARPDAVKRMIAGWADAVWTQGERFGTIGARRGERTYEITTHRAEAYHPDTRKPDVEFADAIETDLSRRDFTVNAMALEVTSDSPVLVDPFDGAADLMTRTLRTPLDPDISFGDDPLRMMRAARFIARFHMTPVPELGAAVRAMRDRLSIVSMERIRDELDKLIMVDSPSAGLWFLVETVSPTSSCPSCRRCVSRTIRSIVTRTSSPTPSR